MRRQSAGTSIGNLYAEGRFGIARDQAQAVAWKRRAAAAGDAEAKGWLLYFKE